MQRVKRSQSIGSMRLGKNVLEKTPEIAAFGQLLREQGQRLLHLLFGRRTQFEPALRDQANHAKQQLGIGSAYGRLQKNQSVYHGKIGIGESRSPGFQLPVEK